MSTDYLNGSRCYCVEKRSFKDRVIFQDHKDFGFYFRLLRKYKSRFSMRILAFSILPNSVYIMLLPRNKKDLHQFIQTLKDGYAQYYKFRYPDDGPVWPRTFCTVPVHSDRELVAGIKSIEFSPVSAEISDNPVSYPWSSCSYRVFRNGGGLLDR